MTGNERLQPRHRESDGGFLFPARLRNGLPLPPLGTVPRLRLSALPARIYAERVTVLAQMRSPPTSFGVLSPARAKAGLFFCQEFVG
jgi:hypothetical protein